MKGKSWMWMVCLLVGFTSVVDAQMIKVEGGAAFSRLKTRGLEGSQVFDKAVRPFQLSVGLEYCEKDWFNLSSSVGYLRGGGRYDVPYYEEAGIQHSKIEVRDYIDYITINTVFNVKRSVRRETYYVGVGPRVDFRVGTAESLTGTSLDELGLEETDLDTNPIVLGLKCEVGFWYTITDHFRLGANFSYLPSFTNAFSSPVASDVRFYSQTFTLGLSLGYVL